MAALLTAGRLKANVLQTRPTSIKHAQTFVKSGAAEGRSLQLAKRTEDESEVSNPLYTSTDLQHSDYALIPIYSMQVGQTPQGFQVHAEQDLPIMMHSTCQMLT